MDLVLHVLMVRRMQATLAIVVVIVVVDDKMARTVEMWMRMCALGGASIKFSSYRLLRASLPCRNHASSSLDDIVLKALGAASADGHGGSRHPGVRAWIAHNEQLGRSPHHPMDVAAPLWAKLNEEWRGMQFVVRLVEERGIQARTAANYWSAVQGWHAKAHGIKIGGGLKLERMPAIVKGLRRLYGDPPSQVAARDLTTDAMHNAKEQQFDVLKNNSMRRRAAS